MSATEFEQQITEALRAIFRAMALTCAGRQTDPLRWSGDDLATDLAPHVAAAIQAAHDDGVADGWGRSIGMAEAALPALRGEP